MRSLLVLLIGLALAISPVTSAMAAPACGMHGSAAMAGMDAPGMPGITIAAVNGPGTDANCDHAGKSGKSCAQACAAICCVGVVLPSIAASPRLFVQRVAATDVGAVAPRSYDPPGLDPPPKLIA